MAAVGRRVVTPNRSSLALKARTAALRRSRREERAGTRSPSSPLTEMSGQDLLAVLDEELLALPESLRAPLVLCYLQGATRDEAAERLGLPLGTLKNHLDAVAINFTPLWSVEALAFQRCCLE